MNDIIHIPTDLEYELTYTEIMDKIKQLQDLAAQRLAVERPLVIKEILDKMALYKITPNDLNFISVNQPATSVITKQKPGRKSGVSAQDIENRRNRVTELYNQHHWRYQDMATELGTTIQVIAQDLTWLRARGKIK